jgi:hypothetical protein
MPRRALIIDATTALLLFVVGCATASFIGRHYTRVPKFYQEEFGPAVMTAIGRGYVEPVSPTGSPLQQFLHLGRRSLAPGEAIPDRTSAPNQFQQGSRYLMLAVAWQWRFTGISWDGVWAIGAALYGLSAVAAYSLFRLFLPPVVAAFGALYMAISAMCLEQVPHLRDYAKAPFMLAALFFIALVGLRPLSRRAIALACAGCGAVVGVGLGFRSDVAVMAPIFLATLVLFTDSRPWTGLATKTLSAAVFVVVLVAVSAPVVFRVWGSGSNPYHVPLLGYTEPFDANLRIVPSVYDFGLEYSDTFVEEAVSRYSERLSGRQASYPSDDYNAASGAYWRAIVRHFPGDALTRVLAAGDAILNLPFQNHPPDFLDAPLPGHQIWDPLCAIFRRGAGRGIWIGLLLVAVAAGVSIRHGLFALFQLLAVSGYAWVEFERRHVFYLEFVSLLGLLIVATLGWKWTAAAVAGRSVRSVGSAMRGALPALGRAAALPAAAAVLVVVSSTALRAYQGSHLETLFQRYIEAPRTSVARQSAADGEIVVVRWPMPAVRTGGYYAMDFDWNADPGLLAVGLRYRTPVAPDLSRTIAVDATRGINRIFFPVYHDPPRMEFEGIEIPASIIGSFKALYDVGTNDALPLPLVLALSGDWRTQRLHQTLRVEGSTTPHDLRFVDTLSRPARLGWTGLASALPLSSGVHVDERPLDLAATIRTLPPVALEKGSALLAHGRIDSGGLAIGLLRGDRWYRRLELTEPGNFFAIVDVDEAGTYVPILTHQSPRAGWRDRFTIFKFGAIAHSHDAAIQ